MKILHTSDWHLGQLFYDYDRTAEQQDMLDQIANIIYEEQPDAMLVSGDIFHTPNPSIKAVEMYNRGLLKMRDACPSMHIIVTAGNHDSASRLVVNNPLWKYFNVEIVGNIARKAEDRISPDYDRHIIAVKSKSGEQIGYVAAIPHSYESNFPNIDPELPREKRVKAYFKGLSERMAEINTERLPVVLMAHMAVNGCDYSGHENLGGMETVDADVFGDGYDYVALGHIHTAININEKVRYCGTPIPVNFGERNEHSVTIVTLQSGEAPSIRVRHISNLIPMEDFPTILPKSDQTEDEIEESKKPKPFDEVLKLISQYPEDKLAYIRLVVRMDHSLTPLADVLVDEAVRGKKCRICRIQTYNYKTPTNPTTQKIAKLTSNDVKSMSPLSIAEMLFEMRGIEFTDRHREMIKEAIIQAENIAKED